LRPGFDLLAGTGQDEIPLLAEPETKFFPKVMTPRSNSSRTTTAPMRSRAARAGAPVEIWKPSKEAFAITVPFR
jgi:hypothetical protein